MLFHIQQPKAKTSPINPLYNLFYKFLVLIIVALVGSVASSQDKKEQETPKQETAKPGAKKREVSPLTETKERMFHIFDTTYDKKVRRLIEDQYPPVSLSLTTLCGDIESPIPPGEEPEKELTLRFTPAYRYGDVEDSENRVAEFRDFEEQNFQTNLDISARDKGVYLYTKGTYLDEDNQDYLLDLDVNRVLRLEGSLTRMIHRLGRDPLDNLDFRGPGGSKTFSMTHSLERPGEEFELRRTEGTLDATASIPYLPGTKVNVGFRQQTRRGHQQATTIGHCIDCHVGSRRRHFNQRLQDFTVGPEVNVGPLTVTYTYRHSDFDEGSRPPFFDYQNPPFVVSGAPIAGDFINVTGRQPFSIVPDTEKNAHKVEARLDLPKLSLYTSFLSVNTENQHTDNDAKLDTFNLRLTARPIKRMTFTGRLSKRDRDNTAPFGIDREIDTIGFDVAYHVLPWTTVSAGYERREIDRTEFPLYRDAINADFIRGDADTDIDITRVGVNARLHKTLTGFVRYKSEEATDPFTKFGTQGNFFPMFPNGDAGQRLAVYRSQTSVPEQTDIISSGLTWSPTEKFAASWTYTYERDDNNEVRWDADNNIITASIWLAPLKAMDFTLSYSYDERDVTADLIHGTAPVTVNGNQKHPLLDSNVPYDSSVHSFAFATDIHLSPKLILSPQVVYSISEAGFNSNVSADIGSFSDLEIRQIEAAIFARYRYSETISFIIGYTYDRYDDNQFDAESGTAHGAYAGASLRF